MTNTTKYLLVGGVALVGVFFVARRMAAADAAAAKPTGLAGAIAGAQQAYDSLKTISFRAAAPTTLDQSGLPYGPSASDGTAAVSDATGVRQLRALVPRSEFYDSKLAGLRE